ncbi:MAG TPA: DNA-directed RNA polymerase subunit beta [Planctomycetes bacterium]|nr:DNA-directed RNA polymerase subunit beta [Planctomycetota bacterium]
MLKIGAGQAVRNFGKVHDAVKIPDLVAIQRRSYERFLQEDVPPTKRKRIGLESLFHEIFPIESYDKSMLLEYLYYELERPRYSPSECRQLRLTYGYPLKISCRMRSKDGEDLAEQAIYLGEIPVMIGGGEFIINGAVRVIVSQLHRSPGVDFLIESKEGDRVLHGGRIIPERGSWIEIGVTRKDVLVVRIDQSSKIPATIFLRAMDEVFGTNEAILRVFYPTKTVPVAELTPAMWAVGSIVDKETGEVVVEAGTQIGDRVSLIQQSNITSGGSSSLIKRTKKAKDEIEAKRWLGGGKKGGDEEVRNWVNKNKQNLRKKYMIKACKTTGGFAFKCVVTKKEDYTLEKDELSALETKLAWYAVDEHKEGGCPDLNDEKRLKPIKKVKSLFEKNSRLEELFRECTKAMEDDSDWIEIEDLDVYKKVQTNEQGIYFFKKIKTGKVKDGYVGLAGEEKNKNLKGQGLQARLKLHFTAGSFADNMLKKWAIKELTECGIVEEVVSEERGKRRKGKVEVIEEVRDPIILNTLAEDDCQSHERSLLKFYMRLRPGNPPSTEKAKKFFEEKFFDSNRYRLGKVGRFRLNRKFGQAVDENEMTLRPEDFLNTMKYIVGLRNNEGEVDDIDHLGNRRLRTIEELAGDEIRKGLLKLRKTVQERMSMKPRNEDEPKRIADLVNSKSVSSSINYFFGRGELSQVVDQTNALSQLTHERRLSALGPGGLNRRRAGFEVRDVHISHYGRVCPIETPEGTNIGLIASLAIFATIDEYGFLLTPYRRVENGKATDKVDYLRADEDMKSVIAAPNTFDPETGQIHEGMVLAMRNGELAQVASKEVDYVDVSYKQIVGVSASLIPFLEHDDANRALMGSNMQRQAVPLLKTEPPLVSTGMEELVGRNSSMVVRAKRGGVVTAVDSTNIVINHTDEYNLAKFVGLNERTCLNQKPVVVLGEKVQTGRIIADGGGTANGVLALGKNLLVGFVSFDGFNFEDAIIVSEKLCKNDSFTSIHIDEFTAEVRETRLGREEFTRDIPNVSEKALRNLDEYGVVCEGTRVCPGDILVGKVVPKSKTELTPEEKLLHAIFGRAGEDVKNDSLELPSGYEGVVIKTERFTRRGVATDEEKRTLAAEIRQYEKRARAKECMVFRQMIEAIHKKFDVNIVDPSTRQKVGQSPNEEVIYEQVENFNIKWVRPASARDDVQKIIEKGFWGKITEIQEEKKRRTDSMKHGDELPSGVLQMVKVYVAVKRALSIGDKVAGRHGNKGVIAKIMPEEDMPFLEDGTSLDILLNPLGVPSRMNVGQILETHLGWVAKVLGFNAVTPVFDGATEDDIRELTAEANELVKQREAELEVKGEVPPDDEFFVNVPQTLKTQLYDGRTGEPFDQSATIGCIYMMKLHHLVDDKIHARATGPYSLITQQPLGGKARTGGQRFGEMEVWALEGYGAAYTLQEMLTVKSDDVEGRTKIYESMVKGQNVLEAGTPLSFDVLCNEIRGLGLNIQLEKKRLGGMAL